MGLLYKIDNINCNIYFFRSKLPLKKKVALRTRAYRTKKDHKKQGDKSSPAHSANKKRVSSRIILMYFIIYE